MFSFDGRPYGPLVVGLALTTLLSLSGVMPARAQALSTEQPDKYTWLEDIHGERQLAWVKEQNARTASVLEKDPHFAALQADALKVLQSPERLAVPVFRGDALYNTWRDADHVRGILRRTTLAGYLEDKPRWETVLDYDALSRDEKQSWVGKGLHCLQPEEEQCLVALSLGGEDAITLREMNLKTARFVEGGFVLPHGKQDVAWKDRDTLLVSRDWGPGTMSESGYPITVREWKRGTPLESAREVFRGETKDNGYGDVPFVLRDAQGHRAALILRSLTTFDTEYYLLLPEGPRKLGLPSKVNVNGLLDGQVIVSLDEDWTPSGQTQTFPKGSVISFDLDAATRAPDQLKPAIVFTPTTQEFAQEKATTKNYLVMTTLEHVQGRGYVYLRNPRGEWVRARLPVKENQTVDIISTSDNDDHFFLEVSGFLTPPSVMLGDAASGTLRVAKSQPPLFDASHDVVEQLAATSRDGTKVPYFVVHRKDMHRDGLNPTLMTAYGGFSVSETPMYSAVTGKLWLERGGVFVLANIRGGGEFGPAWHDAGLKTHRQRIYDDFYAVAQDLVARKITSPEKLGIMGGSNGGLLMGVEFTQHPEMWKAVVIQVPLLDMLGFEHLSAGASWVGEYGSVSVPEERRFLASISPYNQLRPGVHYPEPLIFTTTRDDRVGPVHARKFAARMQEFHDPFYYDEITEGGHGNGADNVQEARTRAEYFTYLTMKLME